VRKCLWHLPPSKYKQLYETFSLIKLNSNKT
jgi:hypothetical protein